MSARPAFNITEAYLEMSDCFWMPGVAFSSLLHATVLRGKKAGTSLDTLYLRSGVFSFFREGGIAAAGEEKRISSRFLA